MSLVWTVFKLQSRHDFVKDRQTERRTADRDKNNMSPNPECDWTTLIIRRVQQKMTFIYKISNHLVPSYISDIMSPLVSDVSNYSLRNSSNYSIPYTRTEVSRRSCVPSSVSLWNSLDETVRNSSTINSFKNNVKSVYSNLQIVPPYYIKSDRKLSVIHACLRNNCSNLKHDLYTEFIEPDFSCRCGYPC